VSISWTSAAWLVPGSRMPLAESFIGMVVRAGQPKPDISTMDALRKTLLAAKSIAYSDSSSGTYLSTIGFKKLGVADEISGKTRKVRGPPSGELVAAVVARGEAEVGFQQVPELIHVPGVDFVGTVPSDVQPPTFLSAPCPRIHNIQTPRLPCCASSPQQMPQPSSRKPD
jgi:molybdate transport system substrate-binding protein